MYTLDALLKDAAQRFAKQPTKGESGPAPDYAEVWNTFTKYIRSCLDQKRGLQTSSFCKIGWQEEKKNLGGSVYRPFFQLTEQFCRAHCSPEAQRKLKGPGGGGSGLCAFEDFNFSKAAIKFSQQLTKDQVFAGLKMLISQLGEAISDGKDIDLEFKDIGKLVCKGADKEPRFQFDAGIYSGGSNVEMDRPASRPPTACEERSAPSFTKKAPELSRGLEVSGMRAETPNMPVVYEEEMPPTPASLAVPPSIQGGDAGQPRTDLLTAQQYKREIAFKESMDRHIGEMEARASEAMREKNAWKRHVEDCLLQERDDIVSKGTRLRENQFFIQQQKLLNENKRKELRQEEIIAASAHDFPKFTEPAAAEMKEFVKGQQTRMRQELDDQVRTNSTLRNLAKQRERQLETNQLDANRAEMRMLRDAERAKKAYDREALATAWNSEIRMKNIWKAIDSHNKVGHQLDDDALPLPPSRSGSTKSAGRLMTGSSRRVPLGASRSMGSLQAS
jgi:hypothetical protein